MYATSKLIIPPRPARNSPFIPKLRIRLRPSLSRGRRGGTNKQANETFAGVSVSQLPTACPDASECINGELSESKDPVGTSSNTNEDSTVEHKSFDRKFVRSKCVSKRKHSPGLPEEITVDSPESALTKISLKAIINRETFYSLPIDTQRMLAELLPVCDRRKSMWNLRSDVSELQVLKQSPSETSAETSLDSEAIWLHPTALSNEFFGKALQDYATRLAQGDFSQRARNRAGLRTFVGGRTRCTQFTSSESIHNRLMVKNSCYNDTNHRNFARQNRRIKLRQTNPGQKGRRGRARKVTSSIGCDAVAPSELKPSPVRTNLPRRIAVVEEFIDRPCSPDKTTSEPTLGEPKPSPFVDSVGSSSPFHPLTELHPHTQAVQAFPTSESPFAPENFTKTSPYPSSLPSTPPLSQKFTHLKNSVRGPDHLASINCSPNSLGSPSTAEIKCSSPIEFPRTPRGSRSQSSNLSSTLPTPMPPPRQTKTLAAMREKLRAKRLMKEAERSEPGQSYYGLPGSMTPHPTSGACGYFHQPAGFLSGASLDLPVDTTRRSSSALSSPRSLNMTPHFLCDKEPSEVRTPSASLPAELVDIKLSSDSPSSPQSLPTADVLSPIIDSAVNSDFMASFEDQAFSTLSLDPASQFFPSSPHSTTSLGSVTGVSLPGSAQSPRSTKSYRPIQCELIQQEQSASAPPTPLSLHSGRTICVGHTSPSPVNSATNLIGVSDKLQSITATSPLLVASGMSLRPNMGPNIQNACTYELVNPLTPSPSNSSSSSFALSFAPSPAPAHLIAPNSSPTSSQSSIARPQLHTSRSYQSFSVVNQPPVAAPLQPSHISSAPNRGPSVNGSGTSTIDLSSSLSSLSPAVTQLLADTTSGRPSTTTRAFFVDGDNLSHALALLQSLNPNATITQQQFLLIPSSNKSQMFLCRAPSNKDSSSTSTLPAGLTLSVPGPATSLSLQESSVASSSSSVHLSNTLNYQTAIQSHPSDSRRSFVKGPSFSETGGVPLKIKPRTIQIETTASPTHTVVPHPTVVASSKSLVCSKAVPNSQLILSPNIMPFKPQTRTASLSDLESYTRGATQPDNSPHPMVPTSTVSKASMVSMCVAPANHSQVTFSLLTHKTPLNGRDTPVVLLSDPVRKPTTLVQQGNHQVDLIQANFVANSNFVQDMNSANRSIIAPPHFTVINSAGSVPSCPQFNSQNETIAILPNSSPYNFATIQPHYNSRTIDNLTIAAQTAVSIATADHYSTQQPTTNYLPAATLVSHGSSTLVFPPVVHAVQPKHRPFVTNRDDGSVNFGGSSS